MVTLQTNEQNEPERNRQKESKSSCNNEKKNAEVADSCNDRKRNIGENCVDDWMEKNDRETLKNHDNRDRVVSTKGITAKEETSFPVRFSDVSGSNGPSTQCSEIDYDDHDDVYIENEEMDVAQKEKAEIVMIEDDDQDYEDEYDEMEKTDEWRRQKVITTRIHREVANSFGGDDDDDDDDGAVVNQTLPSIGETTFGEINVTNSQHVHVGNTNFYKGPVTIKQFVYTNALPIQDKENNGALANHVNGNLSQSKNEQNNPLSYHDYETVTKWLWTWRCAAIFCVVALGLLSIIVVVSVILTQNGDKLGIPSSPSSGIDPDDVLVDGVRFIERDIWSAQPPTERLNKLSEVPAPYVIISHTVQSPCKTQSECVLRVRVAQTLHIESLHFSDIAYNFLVGGDGNAYVGRGWEYEGAHAFGFNTKSIGISFIGTFNTEVPPKRQLHAALKVIEAGVKIGAISPNYKLLGHRQVSETLSPGDVLYNIIKKWDHWSPEPNIKPNRATTINPSTLFCILCLLALYLQYYG